MDLKKIFGTQLFDIDLKDTGDFNIKKDKPKFGKPVKDIASKINSTYGLSDNLKEELIEIYTQVRKIEIYWGLGPASNAPLLSSDEWIKANCEHYTADQNFSGCMNLLSFNEMMTSKEHTYLNSKGVRYLPFDLHWALGAYLRQEKGKTENNLYLFNAEGGVLMDLEIGVLDYLKYAAEAKCFYYWQYALGEKDDFYSLAMKNLLPKFMPKAKLNLKNFGSKIKKKKSKNKKDISASEKSYLELYQWFSKKNRGLDSDAPTTSEIISFIEKTSSLNLEDEKLSELPQAFNLLKKLTHVFLKDNEFISFPTFIFECKETLKRLDLHQNELTSLPDDLGDFSQLTLLDLQGNQLTSLPASIGKLTNLEELLLDKGFDKPANQIEEIPASIGNLTKLKVLNFNNNKLSALPDTMGGLVALERLDLRANQLEALPTSIGNLSELKNLDLQDNKISKVPSSLYKLTKLTRLSLGKNQIKEIAPDIGNLSELDYLRLENNPLAILPKEIGQLKKLEKLYLFSTPFLEFPETIADLSSLKELWLSMKELIVLDEHICQIPNLKLLNLYKNKLEKLPESISQLKHLFSLDLRENNLTELPSSIETMSSLKKLYLSGNNFEETYIQSLKKVLPDCNIAY